MLNLQVRNVLLTVFVVSLCFSGAEASDPVVDAAKVQPLTAAHAHNDYAHSRPLDDALSHGFCSVEADIFLVGDALLVGHERKELTDQRTLQRLYLDPLLKRCRDGKGHVFPGGPEFVLWIDIKTDGEPTYRRLAEVLSSYREMLTEQTSGESEVKRGVRIVISGNRPWQAIKNTDSRLVGIDGRLSDLDSDLSASLLPMISDRWSSHFSWRGKGPMPAGDLEKLRSVVSRAHAAGRRIRFWATPESESVWQVLQAEKVDLINTDQLGRLESFLLQ